MTWNFQLSHRKSEREKEKWARQWNNAECTDNKESFLGNESALEDFRQEYNWVQSIRLKFISEGNYANLKVPEHALQIWMLLLKVDIYHLSNWDYFICFGTKQHQRGHSNLPKKGLVHPKDIYAGFVT